MKIDVITSFNQDYYNKIGRACVESWTEHWPGGARLIVYIEDMDWSAPPGVRTVSFDQLGSDYVAFQQSDEKGRAKTFAKKAYSFIHACNNTTADRLIWLDADVITQQPVPFELLANLCNDQQLSAFMPVNHDGYFSAETGVVCMNTHHPKFQAFMQRYAQRYNDHIKHDLRRFYDGEVFGAVVKEISAEYNNLCQGLKKDYKSPLKHTALGQYLTHYKSKHSKDDFQAQ